MVAVEVRRLAQSAAEASSEVKSLIEQSGEEVAGGSKLVASAAESLATILEAVRANNELMEGIARESREQASAISEVNTAVRQMDEMTQHNAALVEETNAAIEQTETQATDLDRIVDIFRLSDTGRPHATQGAANVKPAEKPGVLQKVASGARALLTQGNAAIDEDWKSFLMSNAALAFDDLDDDHALDAEAQHAAKQFVTFTVGENAYGIDIMAVREIRSWTAITELPDQARGRQGGARYPRQDRRGFRSVSGSRLRRT